VFVEIEDHRSAPHEAKEETERKGLRIMQDEEIETSPKDLTGSGEIPGDSPAAQLDALQAGPVEGTRRRCEVDDASESTQRRDQFRPDADVVRVVNRGQNGDIVVHRSATLARRIPRRR
jgi:hypothetical protein